MRFTEDLHMSALALGPDLLHAYARSFINIRDKASRDGLDNQAEFYQDLSCFCLDTSRYFNDSLKGFEQAYADEHVTVVAEQ